MKKIATAVGGLFLSFSTLVCVSCVREGSPILDMARTGAEFVSTADPILRGTYEAQQRACLSRPEAERDPCIAKVRADWAPVREGLGKLRAAWCNFEPEKCKAQEATHAGKDGGL